jgi:hypothetical protein
VLLKSGIMKNQTSLYLGNKKQFNKDWRIKIYPNPAKNHSRYIGFDKFIENLWDVKKPQAEKDETLNNILLRLENSLEDAEEVKIRGRLRLMFHRAGI